MHKLTTPQAAAYIGVTPGTLCVWRTNRVPHQPPYVKVGSRVWYLLTDLQAYMRSHTVGAS